MPPGRLRHAPARPPLEGVSHEACAETQLASQPRPFRRNLLPLMVRLPAPLLPALIVSLLLLVYAAQTGLGHWQTDEYRYFADERVLGWWAYVARLYVSPRPLSELLIYGYGILVLRFHRPFVIEALLVLWASVMLVMIGAAWSAVRASPPRPWSAQLTAAISLGLAPMLFVMQTNPVTEAFYWPVAAAAYLPAMAGASALLFLLDGDLTARRRLWCGAALLGAAMSHEMGAALAIGFAAVAAVYVVMDHRSATPPRTPAHFSGMVWWLGPGVTGLLVMLGLVVFRSHFVDLGADTKPYTGRLMASAIMALRQLALDVVSTGNLSSSLINRIAAVTEKLTFAVGYALVCLRFGPVRLGRWHFALAFGLGTAAFFSVFAAYYHYGDLCCERQASARHWLIDLLYVLGAAALLARWPALYRVGARTGVSAWLGSLCLCGALMVPAALQTNATRADFSQVVMAHQSRVRTWQSGLAPGSGAMRFYLPPDNDSMLVHGTFEPIATYDMTKNAPDLVSAVGRFFGKDSVTTCQAWQTEQSFLIDRVFIPACPPHDGPPDITFNTSPAGQ